jgi:hypothetical protein
LLTVDGIRRCAAEVLGASDRGEATIRNPHHRIPKRLAAIDIDQEADAQAERGGLCFASIVHLRMWILGRPA